LGLKQLGLKALAKPILKPCFLLVVPSYAAVGV